MFFLGDLLDAFLPARPLSLHARADRCFSVLSWAHGEPLLFPAAVAPVRGCPEAPNGAVRVPPPEAPSPSHASAAWWLWSPLLLAQKPSSDSWDSLVGSRGQGPTGLSGLWAACAGACWSPRTGVPLSARHRLLGWALRCMGRRRGCPSPAFVCCPTLDRAKAPRSADARRRSPEPCALQQVQELVMAGLGPQQFPASSPNSSFPALCSWFWGSLELEPLGYASGLTGLGCCQGSGWAG